MVRQEDEEEEEEEGGVVQLWSHLWQREGSFLSLNMYRLYNPEPWHRYRHLLPASLCQSTVYTQTSASTLTHTKKKGDTQHLTGLRFASFCLALLAGSLHKNLNASCQAISR